MEGRWLLFLTALWGLLVVLSVLSCGAGFLRPEAFHLLPHFLQDRPWYQLVFDVRGTDPATYQARELGHLLSYLDALFIRECTVAGWPHFFSASHYVLLLGCGFLLWQIGTRSLQLGRGVTLGLILLLWTSPSAFLFSSYFRPGKIGLCFGTLLFAAVWLSFQRQPALATRRSAQLGVWLFLAAAALPMYDKQGLAFLFVATAFCVQRTAVYQTPRDRAALLVLGGALVFALAYTRGLSPLLNSSFGSAAPNVDYQSLPMRGLVENPRYLAVVIFGAPVMAVSSLQFVVGNLSLGIVLAALVGVHWVLTRVPPAGHEPWRTLFRPARIYLALLVLVVALFAVLLVRNPYMFTNEHRRFFYAAPLSAVWLVGLAVLAVYIRELWPQQQPWLGIGIAILLVGNVFAIPDHRFVLRQGEYSVYRQAARRLTYVLEPARIRRQSIAAEEAAGLLARAPRQVDGALPAALREDAIFLALYLEYLGRHPGPAR